MLFNLDIEEILLIIIGVGFVFMMSLILIVSRRAKLEQMQETPETETPSGNTIPVEDTLNISNKQANQIQALINHNSKLLADELGKFAKSISGINKEIQKSTVEELKDFTPKYTETLEIIVKTIKKMTGEIDVLKQDSKDFSDKIYAKLETIEHENLLTKAALIYLLNGLQGAKKKELYDKIGKKAGIEESEVKELIKQINLTFII